MGNAKAPNHVISVWTCRNWYLNNHIYSTGANKKSYPWRLRYTEDAILTVPWNELIFVVIIRNNKKRLVEITGQIESK